MLDQLARELINRPHTTPNPFTLDDFGALSRCNEDAYKAWLVSQNLPEVSVMLIDQDALILRESLYLTLARLLAVDLVFCQLHNNLQVAGFRQHLADRTGGIQEALNTDKAAMVPRVLRLLAEAVATESVPDRVSADKLHEAINSWSQASVPTAS